MFRRHHAVLAALIAFQCLSGAMRADTAAFTIVNDPQLDAALANARSNFLAQRAQNQPSFNRLDVTILVPDTNGTWRRGSFNGDTIAYPASCVKLAYMAAAMYWCRTNNYPYNYLDADVGPMIRVSDNYATGRVVDRITGMPNYSGKKPSDPPYSTWYAARLYTENYLGSRGLLENQTMLHKTYPTNSGSSPSGYEQDAIDQRGGNRMQPKCSASLMLEIIKGAIEPGANAYMRDLLTHDRWSGDSMFGFGLPPGTIYENKLGVAYDTLEDIAYVVLPNGKEFILAAYSNGFSGSEPSQPYPYDASILGVFCEMVIEQLGLDAGCPPKLKLDDADAAVFSTSGAWTVGTAQSEKYGPSYKYKSGGTGSGTATWNLNVPQTGLYEVSVWYPQGSNRATDAPFTVNHAGGASTVRINQQKTGGRWVRLGDYQFNAGQGTVVLSDNIANASQIVVADAVKAVKWPATAAPPNAPSGLTATAVSSSQINLAWTDNSNDETEFVIAQSTTAGGPYTDIATVGANTTSYSRTGLSPSTTYYFVVRAVNAAGNSPNSNQASATTQGTVSPPAAPSGLTATAVSKSQINLTWTDNSNNEDSFIVERKTTGAYSVVATLPAGTTSYQNTGLARNTTYTYRVKARNTGGDSAYSNEATAKTLSK
jgi:hypothetical protein